MPGCAAQAAWMQPSELCTLANAWHAEVRCVRPMSAGGHAILEPGCAQGGLCPLAAPRLLRARPAAMIASRTQRKTRRHSAART